MEVYAGYSENADYNVGRVIDAIDELGELDDTLIIWIWGDNGASMEGTITGTFNELTMLNGIPLTDEMQLQLAERYGGIGAWGGHDDGPALLGGVGLGGEHAIQVGQAGRLAPRWEPQPAGRALAGARQRPGGLRSQFTHVIDVAPDDPRRRRGFRCQRTVDGIAQEPMHGTIVRSPRSTTPMHQSTAPSSTSRPSATERCTRTAGGWR